MGKNLRRASACAALLSLIALAACTSPIDGGSAGRIRISVADGISSRSLVPSISMDPASYRIEGTGPGAADSFSETIASGSSLSMNGLSVGSWSIVVTALNAAGTAIGAGSAAATINAAQTTMLSVVVSPYAGTGSLGLSLSWPAGSIATPVVSASLAPNPLPTETLNFIVDTENNSASCSVSGIAAGYYTLSIQLLDSGASVAGAGESVRIVAGQTTSGAFAFSTVNGVGTLTVTITPSMNNPLTVSIAGAAASKTVSQSLALSASVAESVTPSYAWYVNGAAAGTGSTYTFGNAWSVGYYRIDVIAFTADGSRAGSATAGITVTE